MTHPSHEHRAGTLPFSDAAWQALQADDLKAGKAVIGLMMVIFSIGLFLYFGVFLVVWANPVH
jgi:hypothetical protein